MASPERDFLGEDCRPIDNPGNKNYITLINSLYKFILDNRDALGYPRGSNNLPYVLMTNDVANKVLELVKICLVNKDKLDARTFRVDVVQWIELLILSYDELKNEKSSGKGCCALHATAISREQAEAFAQQFEAMCK